MLRFSDSEVPSKGDHKQCSAHEQYSDCAHLPPKCQHLCPNAPPTGIRCTEMCAKRCVCKTGYVRDPSKHYKCVLEADCKKKA
uniref:TIL domain-containing protein n=1 Tax=Romanomermis culicivorax TaxID=13658 RepID=A0A915J8Z9_ROMCU